MPKIAEYELPESVTGLRPTETGISATAHAARLIGGQYSEIARMKEQTGHALGSSIAFAGTQAVEARERFELSQGAAAYAGLMNAKAKEWHETNKNADPNDPTVEQKFQSGLQAELEKFQTGFLTRKGQAWAEDRALALQQHYTHLSNADRANARGHAYKINADTTVQGLANAAMWNGGNETDVVKSIDDLKKSGFPEKHFEEGKGVIVDRAVRGYIERHGEVPEWVKKPEYAGYIDATDLNKMKTQARQVRGDNEHTEKINKQQAEFEFKKNFNKQADDFSTATLPLNNESKPQLPTDWRERLTKMKPPDDAPDALHKAWRSLNNRAATISERLNKEEPLADVSHRNVVGLLERIRSGQVTSEEQIDEFAKITVDHPKGQLTTADWNLARKEFYERKNEDGVTISHARGDFWRLYSRSIDPAITQLGEHSVLGDQQIHKANLAARIEEERLRAKGENPHLVYDERSEYFFGRADNMRKYSVSMQQVNAYNAAVRRGETPQNIPMPDTPAPVTPAPPKPGQAGAAPVAIGPPVTKTTAGFMKLPENVPTQAPNRKWYYRQGDKLIETNPPATVPMSQ